MWRAIDNGGKAGQGGFMPSPVMVSNGIYLLFDNDEIPGKSCLVVRPDDQRKSIPEAIRAGEAYMNRRSGEKYSTEGGVIDMYGNSIKPSRPVPGLRF